MIEAIQVIDNIPLPILVIDLIANEVHFVNKSFCKLMVCKQEEVQGKPSVVLDKIFSLDESSLLKEKLSYFSDAENILIHFHTGDTADKYVCSINSVIQDDFAFSICTFVPFTASIDSSKQSLYQINGLQPEQVHSFRVLLVDMIEMSRIISRTQKEENSRKLFQEFGKKGSTMLDTLDSITFAGHALSNNRILEFHRTDIKPIINEILQKYVRELSRKHVYLKFVTTLKEIVIFTDEGAIAEVLDILISQAVRMTAKGEIVVEVKDVYHSHEKRIAIHIIDSGIGYRKSHIESLSSFTLFMGNDVDPSEREFLEGLVYCKNMVDRLTGMFLVKSEYGTGSEIILSFVMPPQEKTTEESGPQQAKALIEVLVVDDDDDHIYRLLKKQLTDKCNVDYVPDGRHAITASARKKYDIIFMDINLGVGLTGLQVVRRLREIPFYQHVPVVAVTAYPLQGDREKAMEVGCNFYFTKPLTKEKLIEILNRSLELIASNKSGSIESGHES